MRQIDGIIGNRYDDPNLGERIDAHERDGTLERVVIDPAERKKSRLRVETDAGTDLGILVDRPELRAGDVLFADNDRAAVVTFRRLDAYVIELSEQDTGIATAVELGHRIGNQHWAVAVENSAVYVPVEADRHVFEDVLEDSIPASASTHYEKVDASLFLEDSDGGGAAEYGGRDHDHDHDYSHGQGHDVGHDHDHGSAGSQGLDHSHE